MVTVDSRRQAMILLGFPPCASCGGYTETMMEDARGRPLCSKCHHALDVARLAREVRDKLERAKQAREYRLATTEAVSAMSKPSSRGYVEACQSDIMQQDLRAIAGAPRLGRRGRFR